MSHTFRSGIAKLFRLGWVIAIVQLSATLPVWSSCNPPFFTGYSDRHWESITVNWLNLFGSDAWELELVGDGEPFTGIPGSGKVGTPYYRFEGLESGRSWCFRIRSICDEVPGAWSQPYCFTTSIAPDNDCSLDFDLQDPLVSQAYAETSFYYIDEDHAGKRLGEEVFIQSVELIIEHAWPSDLEIRLRSPGGKQIILSDQEGFNSKNYGVPDRAECDSTALFSDEACLSVRDQAPLVGEFGPEQSFYGLYDGSPVVGNWVLSIRDHNNGHQGLLKYFRIHLSEQTCRLPEVLYLETAGPDAVRVNWEDPNHSCDSIIMEYGPEGFIPGSGKKETLLDLAQSYLVQGLLPSTAYDFFFRAACNGSFSVVSCPYQFTTECHTISSRESFDFAAVCELNCEAVCPVSDLWFNRTHPYNQWLVNSGATATPDTGPDADVAGIGNYIYVESSENDCDFEVEGVLETDCLYFKSNPDGCDFSFYYHMNGPDIGVLSFQITVDDGENWDQLFELSGDQGNSWQRMTLDLSAYDGLAGRARFVAVSSGQAGADRGDIALDELIFYGTEPAIKAQYLFYPDVDGDNYGDALDPVFFCSNALVEGYSRNNLDCDDRQVGINPEAQEIPCNSIDENCNGMEDDLDAENPLLILGVDVKEETCKGSSDATISFQVAGGMGPYQFLWSNGSTDSLLTDIGSGGYFCEITDQFGCRVISDSVVVAAATPMIIEQIQTDIVSCNGARDGQILISHTGGMGPYSYLWNSGDTIRDLTNIGPGNYMVTITDANGCELVSPGIQLIAATNFSVGLDVQPPLCAGDFTGSIQIIGVQKGEPPYTFDWSTGDSLGQITMLGAGYYTLTVTDANYCFTVVDSIHLADPDPLNVQVIAKDDVTCYGDDDGAIEINAFGGMSPYTFQWTRNGQLYSTSDDLFNIRAGTYQLTLRDNNGCAFQTDQLWVQQPQQIHIQIDSIKHADCIESANGSIQVNVTGGSGAYQYFWDGDQGSGPSIENLNPGLYQLVVTDRYGCKALKNGIELDYLNIPVDLNLHWLDTISCFGDQTGRLEVFAPHAALPLDYNWSAGIKRIKYDTRDTLHQIGSGWYQVTLTDAAGCVGVSEPVWLDQPSPLKYQVMNIRSLDCAGDYSGAVSISISGGIKPYSYLWNNGKKTSSILHLDGGYYQCLVTDANLCNLTVDSIFVYEPQPISVTQWAIPASSGLTNGAATVIASGGTTPYQYTWDSNTGNQTGQTATQLAAGEYFVTVTDFNLCEKEALVIVPLVDQTDQLLADHWVLYPNPVRAYFYLSGEGVGDRVREIRLFNSLGVDSGKVAFVSLDQDLIRIEAGNRPSGIYLLYLNLEEGDTSIRIVIP